MMNCRPVHSGQSTYRQADLPQKPGAACLCDQEVAQGMYVYHLSYCYARLKLRLGSVEAQVALQSMRASIVLPLISSLHTSCHQNMCLTAVQGMLSTSSSTDQRFFRFTRGSISWSPLACTAALWLGPALHLLSRPAQRSGDRRPSQAMQMRPAVFSADSTARGHSPAEQTAWESSKAQLWPPVWLASAAVR